VLSASVHDVRHFAAMLRGVQFANNNNATISLTEAGMTVAVEDSRTLLATAYIPHTIFDEWTYTPPAVASEAGSQQSQVGAETVRFDIQLATMIECLNIFRTSGYYSVLHSTISSDGDSKKKNWKGEDAWAAARDAKANDGGDSGKPTAMRMSYAGAGHPLTLLLAQDASGPKTACHLTTLEPEEQIELPFDDDKKIVRIIMKSTWLRDALSELDPKCDKLTFICSPPSAPLATANSRFTQRTAQPTLRLLADGTFGRTEMDYPNDRDVLETFECEQLTRFSYRFGHIARTQRALQNSVKTSIRMDEDGVLSLQFMMPSVKIRGKESANQFIEFRCLALDE